MLTDVQPPRRFHWIERSTLALIVVLGLVLRVWGIGFGLPHGLTRPDEEKIVGAAVGVFGGDWNPHLFLYPSLFIYLEAAGFWLVFLVQRAAGIVTTRADFLQAVARDPSVLLVVGRLLAAAFGVGTIAALYGAVRELFSVRAALVAAALLALVFLHVRDSHFGVTDVPVTFIVVAAWWGAVRCFKQGVTHRRVAITGLLAGFAASTKYNAALAALPLAVVIAARTLRVGRSGLTSAAASLLVLSSPTTHSREAACTNRRAGAT